LVVSRCIRRRFETPRCSALPRRTTQTSQPTLQTLKNVSYENMLACWLMQDGWEVYSPLLDHGHKTDLLISDGPNFHRLQVKTFCCTENFRIQNCWKGSNVTYIILFARNGDWGIISPAFSSASRPLKHQSHRKFRKTKRDFLREFHQI